MKYDNIFQITVLFVVCLFLWLLARSEHSAATSSKKQLIQAPKMVRILFGISGTSQTLNIRGVMGQMLSIAMFFLFSLYIFGYIAENDLAKYIIGMCFVVIVSAGFLYWVACRFWN